MGKVEKLDIYQLQCQQNTWHLKSAFVKIKNFSKLGEIVQESNLKNVREAYCQKMTTAFKLHKLLIF